MDWGVETGEWNSVVREDQEQKIIGTHGLRKRNRSGADYRDTWAGEEKQVSGTGQRRSGADHRDTWTEEEKQKLKGTNICRKRGGPRNSLGLEFMRIRWRGGVPPPPDTNDSYTCETQTNVFSIPKSIQATVTLLENLHVILEKTPRDDIRSEVLPMLYNAFESTTIQVQVPYLLAISPCYIAFSCFVA
uniref:Uncharacterized protein n=1 Tax=Timema cristinae TaxID=61476 RepID=A0A7R9H6A7_TIMCR|nr:unnamed protein product [Timema cristinae]